MATQDVVKQLQDQIAQMQAQIESLSAEEKPAKAKKAKPAAKAKPKARKAPARKAPAPKAAPKARRGRPKGPGKRGQQVIALVKRSPGITIPEIAKRAGVQAAYLYKLMPNLASQGLVVKSGSGFYPDAASAKKAKPAPKAKAAAKAKPAAKARPKARRGKSPGRPTLTERPLEMRGKPPVADYGTWSITSTDPKTSMRQRILDLDDPKTVKALLEFEQRQDHPRSTTMRLLERRYRALAGVGLGGGRVHHNMSKLPFPQYVEVASSKQKASRDLLKRQDLKTLEKALAYEQSEIGRVQIEDMIEDVMAQKRMDEMPKPLPRWGRVASSNLTETRRILRAASPKQLQAAMDYELATRNRTQIEAAIEAEMSRRGQSLTVNRPKRPKVTLPAPRPASKAKPKAAKPAPKKGQLGRPKGPGKRGQQVIALVKRSPGITIPEIAKRANMQATYLYKLMPNLAKQGLVVKSGSGFYPDAASAKKAKAAPKAKAKPAAKKGQLGRPKGPGKRGQQAIALVRKSPGITTTELAKQMGMQPTYLYSLMPNLAKQGLVVKSGSGFYPDAASAKKAKAAPKAKPAAKAAPKGQRGRPKGPGKRGKQVIDLVAKNPGITVSELAKRTGVQPAYLYRLMPNLASQGLVVRSGSGFYSDSKAAAKAPKPAAKPKAAPKAAPAAKEPFPGFNDLASSKRSESLGIIRRQSPEALKAGLAAEKRGKNRNQVKAWMQETLDRLEAGLPAAPPRGRPLGYSPKTGKIEPKAPAAKEKEADLPFPGYDRVASSDLKRSRQILVGRSVSDLQKAIVYERKNQARDKIIALEESLIQQKKEGKVRKAPGTSGKLPVEDYDVLPTQMIARTIGNGFLDDRLTQILAYERGNANRPEIIEAVEARMKNSGGQAISPSGRTFKGREPWPGYGSLDHNDPVSLGRSFSERSAPELRRVEAAENRQDFPSQTAIAAAAATLADRQLVKA